MLMTDLKRMKELDIISDKELEREKARRK